MNVQLTAVYPMQVTNTKYRSIWSE